MKKFAIAMLCAVSVVMIAQPVYAGTAQGSHETAITKVGDWLATIGKNDTQKQNILAQRRTERMAKAAAKAAKKAGKHAEQSVNKLLK